MSVAKDKKTGTWYYRIRVYDDYGTYIKQSKKRGFKTKKEAKEAEALAGIIEVKSGISFQTVEKAYMSHYKIKNKPVSAYTIERRIEVHIMPCFGKRKMENISVRDILEWQNDLVRKGLSVGYIQAIKTTLSSIFLHGMRYYNLKANPVTVAESVKQKYKPEMKFWTIAELRQFLKLIDDPLHYALFSTLFWTGLRRSELLALRWVDIDGNVIHVRHSIAAKEGSGTWRLSTPKTPGSRRDILMTSELKSIIDDLFKRQRHQVEFNRDYFIFGDVKPMGATTLLRIYNNYIAISSVKRIRIHDFRHSFASALIEAGVDIMVLAKMMGHTSREQIYKTYGHLYPDKQAEAIQKLESVSKVCPPNKKAPKIGTF